GRNGATAVPAVDSETLPVLVVRWVTEPVEVEPRPLWFGQRHLEEGEVTEEFVGSRRRAPVAHHQYPEEIEAELKGAALVDPPSIEVASGDDGADRAKVRRPRCRGQPLAGRRVRPTDHPEIAVAPRQ